MQKWQIVVLIGFKQRQSVKYVVLLDIAYGEQETLTVDSLLV